jgi:hypothetical protein
MNSGWMKRLTVSIVVLTASGLYAEGYPPELVLREQSLICKAPDALSDTASMWVGAGNAIRGYQFFHFSVDPGDPAKGSVWLAYDCGQRRPIIMIEDMNTICGVEAKSGVSGQRITATMQTGLLLGTGPATGATVFPGGAVVRLPGIPAFGTEQPKLVGRLPEGWGVVDFHQQYLGPFEKVEGQIWPSGREGTAILLAGNLDQSRFALYRVLYDKLEPLGIEGGSELRSFFVADQNVFYRDANGKVWKRPLDKVGDPEETTVEPGSLYDLCVQPDFVDFFRGDLGDAGGNCVAPEPWYGFRTVSGDVVAVKYKCGRGTQPNQPELASSVPGLMKSVQPLAADMHPRQKGWAGNPWTGIGEGFVVFAKKTEEGKPPHFYLYCPQIGKTDDLGAPAAFDGEEIDTIHQVRVTAGGEIAALVGNAKVQVFQLYHFPLEKQVTAEELVSTRNQMGKVAADRKTVPFRMVKNLYELDRVADRGFDSMTYASDGKVYFGTMPHDPILGASIFRYDPKKTDTVEQLGKLDELSGTKKESVHNMMHAVPAEVNGRLYFTGQDPYYGNRTFPGWTKEKNLYEGSPLVMYDLKEGTFTNLGIPFPDRKEGIFGTVGDSKRNVLYVKFGYDKAAWYELGLDGNGKLNGKNRELPLTSGSVILAQNGLFYEIRFEKGDGKTPVPGQIWSYDPASGEPKKLVEFTAEGLNGSPFELARKNKPVGNYAGWLKAIGDTAYLFFGDAAMVARFDIQTGKIEKVAQFLEPEAKYPAPLGTAFQAGNQIHYVYRASGRIPALSVLDLSNGTVTRYGQFEDDKGRILREITQFTNAPDGKIYFGGSVTGHPEDGPHWLRTEYAGPYKVVSGFFEISDLPK